jgi:hypothetical protein
MGPRSTSRRFIGTAGASRTCPRPADEATLLADAVHQYFQARATGSRRQLRELFRRGRISLLIGLAFLGGSLTLSDIIGNVSGGSFGALLREGFIIGGWVAMWRPLEVFLYDWWPVLGEVRLLDRLGAMPVRIEYKETVSDDAWRADWPAVPSGERPDSETRRLSKAHAGDR